VKDDVDPSCPDEEVILGFVARTLSPSAREEVAAHVEACDDCRALLAAMGVAPGEASTEGRYELLSTLGAGGMGIVQAAFDRELDRKVALKFIVADDRDDERARARLLREAKALAQLAHPNVITVHDVGVLDGDVFVAMELVDGENLREWLASEPRTLAAKLDVLRQAGEGLAAAHAAGIVHRDFKPENVLVGRDGRARVTDFGLARPIDADDEPAPADAPLAQPPPVTRTGVRAGTPAYMAPEQRLGRAADARSDLYSYCVTVHEAVTGTRPASGDAASRRAPRWLDRVLARGLADRPDDRWASMRALLDAIARGPLVTSGRVAAVLGVVALVAGGIASSRHRPETKPLCALDPAAFAGVWDEPQRSAVLAAFRAAEPANAEAAFGVVDAALGRMRERWIGMRAESCAATRIRRDQSEAVLDLRTGCLDVEREKASALVQVLAKADRVAVNNAGAAVAQLPAVDDCANVRTLSAIDPPPADLAKRAVVDGAQSALARATALHTTGKEKDALALVDPALVEVRSAGYEPLEAQLLVLRADVLWELDRPAGELEAAMHEAAQKAVHARDDAAAAAAWTLLLYESRGKPSQARVWAGYAEAAIGRLGGDDFLEAHRCTRLGQVELTDGRLDAARALFEKAVPLFERTRGPGYYRIGSILDGLAEIAVAEQRFEEAARYRRLGRELRERAVGRDNVATVSSRFNEVGDLLRLGKLDAAAASLAELDATYARNEDPDVAYLQLTHAMLARARGDFASALAADEISKRVWEPLVAANDAGLRAPLTGLGLDYLGLGRPADAIAPLERAATFSEGATPSDRSETLFALARALDGARRDRARALSLARKAAELLGPPADRYGGEYVRTRDAIDRWVRERS
jgi:predicted Ser/Thr protein kinase